MCPAAAAEPATSPAPSLEMLEYLGEWAGEITLEPALLEHVFPPSGATRPDGKREEAP